MVIFNIKGRAIEDLPERQIEAETREEAESKYLRMFEEGMIETSHADIVFYDEESGEGDVDGDFEDEVEGEDGEENYIDEGEEDYDDGDEDEVEEDYDDDEYEDDDDEDLPDPKIVVIQMHERPTEIWDHADHTDYYLENGYMVVDMGQEGSENEVNYLYKKKSVSVSSSEPTQPVQSSQPAEERSFGEGSSSESQGFGSGSEGSSFSDSRPRF